MPFENELVSIELSLATMDSLYLYIAKVNGQPISGFDIQIRDGVVSNVTMQKLKSSIRVLTTDYLAAGGDRMNFFADSITHINSGLKLRDAIMQHVIKEEAAGRSITKSLDGRISDGK